MTGVQRCALPICLKDVLKQLNQRPGSILFIDEIHTIIGAGSASGGVMDASNLIKPMLSNGELKCIGSTTYAEFRSIFEKDHALARRLQKIDIEEPSIEETVEILKGLKSRFEEHHDVKYSNNALRAAAELSQRYIMDRFLPDKAIDVIDEAGGIQPLRRKSELQIAYLDYLQGTIVKDRIINLTPTAMAEPDNRADRTAGKKGLATP